jgi:hypothetical protein
MMTLDMIERIVERRFDRLDSRFTARLISQEEYDLACERIDKWAKWEYRFAKEEGTSE